MQVTLISHTENPVLACAFAARTCVTESPGVPQDAEGVVRRVLGYGHESIAEHASFTFLIEGISRACSHQLVRYRHASYAQQSQRYVPLDTSTDGTEYYVVPESISSSSPQAVVAFGNAMLECERAYKKLLDAGIPPEDARYILPNATCTNITVTVNAAELRHMMRQRLCTRAQWEIRDLVGAMVDQVNEVAPVLFEGVGPACLNGECPEGAMSCGKPWKG